MFICVLFLLGRHPNRAGGPTAVCATDAARKPPISCHVGSGPENNLRSSEADREQHCAVMLADALTACPGPFNLARAVRGLAKWLGAPPNILRCKVLLPATWPRAPDCVVLLFKNESTKWLTTIPRPYPVRPTPCSPTKLTPNISGNAGSLGAKKKKTCALVRPIVKRRLRECLLLKIAQSEDSQADGGRPRC